MGNSVFVKAVPAAELDEWLPKIEWHLESFSERGRRSMLPEDFIPELQDGSKQLWLVLREDNSIAAAALTCIQDDRTKTCIICNCAGERPEEWADVLLATVLVWSRAIGSTKLETVSRPGWEKLLKPLGMRRTHTVLEYFGNGI